MRKIIYTLGLPASGKTTWAKNYVATHDNCKRVNKDDLRAMMDKSWSKENEEFVLKIRDYIVEQALKSDKTIIVDDTGFAIKHEYRLREIAHDLDAEFEIKDFSGVSLDTCIERDKLRTATVGEDVIRKMYSQFFMGNFMKNRRVDFVPPETYVPMEDKPEAILVDVDGTLAEMHKGEPGKRYPYDWKRVGEDDVHYIIADLVRMYDAEGVKIIIMSGRNSVCRKETEDWLEFHEIPYEDLFMRGLNDNRRDSIVKRELFEDHIKDNYNVLFVLDDRDQVVREWRKMGLRVLQVAEGDF